MAACYLITLFPAIVTEQPQAHLYVNAYCIDYMNVAVHQDVKHNPSSIATEKFV
jgi:hypothetical protein